MRSRLFRCIPGALIALGFFLGVPSVSNADFIVQLTDGAAGDAYTIDYTTHTAATTHGTVSVTGSIIYNLNPSPTTVFEVLLNGTISLGGVTVTNLDSLVTTGGLNYTTINTNSAGSGSLFINTAIGGTSATFSGLGTVGIQSSVSDIPGSSPPPGAAGVTFASYVNTSNTSFFSGSPITFNSAIATAQTATLSGATSFGTTGTVQNFTASGLFSVGNQMDVTFTQAGSLQLAGSTFLSGSFTPVPQQSPAPASALLALAGVPVFGLMWVVRRRRSKDVNTSPAIA